ncbi:energy transducer TonB [Candidatus Latescibacterota bacterium]
MFRDIIFSSIGHLVVIVSLAIASLFNPKPEIESFDIYQVKTITPQSISELIKRNEVVDKPTQKVPQIQTDTKVLPNQHRKAAQAVKRSTPSNNTTAITKTESKTSGLKGVQVDSEINIEYLLELRNRIEKNWRPPKIGKSLITRVYFNIGKNGKIQRVFIEKPTGNITFDSSAYNAVSESDPFSPLPEDFENENLGVHFDFIYEID